jgi:hypothetical protein
MDDDGTTPQEIFTGHDTEHVPVGLVPGKQVRFVVSVTNFFGSSEYSNPSELVAIPEVRPLIAPVASAVVRLLALTPCLLPALCRQPSRPPGAAVERVHCPYFMAGFCPR